ncbi:MAG TPA: beta-N-acetylhexosaminidase [Polyangiaceae bacterium]|nr:beta-N-acetylhexosaminidase [Polyangiaceae bacterium]
MVLDLRTSAAQLLTIGFHGRSVDSELERLLERGVGGVIFFSRNVGSASEVADLTATIKRRAGRPLILSVDQEGGTVARLREGFTPIPTMRTVGKADDAELSFSLGKVIGRELRAVGFDLDYAPVLDVDTNPDNPVIGARSFGSKPELVAWHGLALIAGLANAKVAACGKHFPGHGDTHQDSHKALPELDHRLERLEAVELVPFAAAVKAAVPALMTAHVVFKPLDPEWPATMSAPILRGVLRDKLGYSGLIVTDDLEMKAIAEHYSIEDVVVRGLNAGVDMFTCCHTPEKMQAAIDAIAHAVARGHVSTYRFEQALERVHDFMARWVEPPLETFDARVLGSSEHRALVERISEVAEQTAPAARHDPMDVLRRFES